MVDEEHPYEHESDSEIEVPHPYEGYEKKEMSNPKEKEHIEAAKEKLNMSPPRGYKRSRAQIWEESVEPVVFKKGMQGYNSRGDRAAEGAQVQGAPEAEQGKADPKGELRGDHGELQRGVQGGAGHPPVGSPAELYPSWATFIHEDGGESSD